MKNTFKLLGVIALAAVVVFTATACATLLGSDKDDFVVRGTTLISYKGSKSEVVIPADMGITAIGEKAFVNNKNITSVIIPEGVTTIGHSAFSECSGLTNVVIPEGVTSISNYAFNKCGKLNSIVIPASVKRVSRGAFYRCNALPDDVRADIRKRFGSEDVFGM